MIERRYSLHLVDRALAHESKKIHGFVGVDPMSFSLEELRECGVSDDGIHRVLRESQMNRAPVSQIEPSLPTSVFIHQSEDLSRCVPVTIKIELPSSETKLQHNSSSRCGCSEDSGAPSSLDRGAL